MGAKTVRKRPAKRVPARAARPTPAPHRNGKRRGGFFSFSGGIPSAAARVEPADEHVFRRYRRNLMLVLVVGVVAAFDTQQQDTFTLTKYTLALLGVLALLPLAAVSWARAHRAPVWRSGLQWPLAALVVWAAVSTATSVAPGLSIHGLETSREGLLATVAFGLLLVLVVDAFDARHLKRAAAVLWYGAGGAGIGYAALQLHDQLTSWGGTWDFVKWGHDPLAGEDWIFSTFGNPNHLAGLVALMLPIGIALLCTRQPWWAKAVTVGLVFLGIAELLYTTTRGAWLAVLVSLPLLAVLLARELWARRRLVLALAGAGVAIVAVVVLTVSTPVAVTTQFASIFESDGHTRVERTELWRAAWRMAADRPLVGYGPETYELEFNRYQTARFVREDGPENAANGPHNTFFNYLATMGFPALAFFMALVALAGLRGVGALRRLGQLARSPDDRKDRATGEDGRAALLETRLLLAGLMAAGTAYLVQATFNTQDFSLSLLFWVILGLVATVTVDAGVPDTLRPGALLAATPPAVPPAPGGLPLAPERLQTDAGHGESGSPDGVTVAVGVAVTVAVALAGWWVVSPYRADALARDAANHAATADQLAKTGQFDQLGATAGQAAERYRDAIALAPWTAGYRARLGDVLVGTGKALLAAPDVTPAGRQRALDLFAEARLQYRRAAEIGRRFSDQIIRGDRLAEMAAQPVPNRDELRAEAVAAYRLALEGNPFSLDAAGGLAALYAAGGEHDRGVAVLRTVLARQQRDVDRVKGLADIAAIYEKSGAHDQARATWEQVLALDPDHEKAKKALAA